MSDAGSVLNDSVEAESDTASQDRPGYELFVLGLSIVAVVLLVLEYTAPIGAETLRLIQWADLVLCVLFFVDFVRSLRAASNKWAYMRSSGWLDLLSSVPAVEQLRLARAARVLRVIRVIRVLIVSHELGRRLRARPRQNALLTAAFACGVLLVAGSVAVLEFEQGAGNINSASDALWWALSTITTVGYGDHSPVTMGGRLVGALLMLCGVGTFGLMAGLLASSIVGGHSDSDEAPEPVSSLSRMEYAETALSQSREEVAALRTELRALRTELAERRLLLVRQEDAEQTAHHTHHEGAE